MNSNKDLVSRSIMLIRHSAFNYFLMQNPRVRYSSCLVSVARSVGRAWWMIDLNYLRTARVNSHPFTEVIDLCKVFHKSISHRRVLNIIIISLLTIPRDVRCFSLFDYFCVTVNTFFLVPFRLSFPAFYRFFTHLLLTSFHSFLTLTRLIPFTFSSNTLLSFLYSLNTHTHAFLHSLSTAFQKSPFC